MRDERSVYERLCLEGFQSGLSWLTILRKREAFRRAFAGFDPEVVAAFAERDVERLLGDAGIVRHRGKIEATIANARATVALREAGAPLHELLWRIAPAAAGAATPAEWHASTPESTELAKRSQRPASASSGRRPSTRRCRRAGRQRPPGRLAGSREDVGSGARSTTPS